MELEATSFDDTSIDTSIGSTILKDMLVDLEAKGSEFELDAGDMNMYFNTSHNAHSPELEKAHQSQLSPTAPPFIPHGHASTVYPHPTSKPIIISKRVHPRRNDPDTNAADTAAAPNIHSHYANLLPPRGSAIPNKPHGLRTPYSFNTPFTILTLPHIISEWREQSILPLLLSTRQYIYLHLLGRTVRASSHLPLSRS